MRAAKRPVASAVPVPSWRLTPAETLREFARKRQERMSDRRDARADQLDKVRKHGGRRPAVKDLVRAGDCAPCAMFEQEESV